jgi:hypothetical protein
MLTQATEETLRLLMNAQKSASPALASKAYNQALGLVYYDLEPVAKQLYPVITPLRNKIPRVKGDGGTATHWKAVTGININLLSPGVEEGKRGGVVTTSEQDFVASYKGIGLEDYVTFESEWAGENFDNIRALAVENLLRAMFIAEEQVLLNANGGGLLLGTCPTPAATLITGVGSMSAGGTKVFCVALTPEGMAYAGGPGLALAATAIQTSITRNNAGPTGGSSSYGGGSSAVSVGSNTVTTTGSNLAVYATVAAVNGAAGYAWFVKGGVTTAGAAPLHSITTVPCQLFSADGASTQFASVASADNSANALVPDGVITQILATTGLHTSNAVPTAAAIQTAAGTSLATAATLALGTVLTTNSAGGVTEIDADLKSFWDNRRLSPTEMWVNSQELQSISKLTIAGGAAPLFRFNMDAGRENTVIAGAVVGSYLNRFTMSGGHIIPIRLHPNMTPGRILYWSDSIPYPLSNVRNVIQVKTRRDYYQIEWPLIDRTYQYGVYADELLQIYAPFAFGVRDGIGPS